MASPNSHESDLDTSTTSAAAADGDQVATAGASPADRSSTAHVDSEQAETDEFDDDDFEDDDLEDEAPATAVEAAPPARRSLVRRLLLAVIATVAFEVIYAISIGLVAFFSGGFAAVGPTLQSAIATPFAWAPAVVFLVCFIVYDLVQRGGRRSLVIGTLIAAVVVYLASIFVVLLVAGGWSVMSLFTQELGVYPFFLTGIIAREVLFWSFSGRARR